MVTNVGKEGTVDVISLSGLIELSHNKQTRRTSWTASVRNAITNGPISEGTIKSAIGCQHKQNNDDLNMQKVGEGNGLKFDYWTKEHSNLSSKIAELKSSQTDYYRAAQVKYDKDARWVGVN